MYTIEYKGCFIHGNFTSYSEERFTWQDLKLKVHHNAKSLHSAKILITRYLNRKVWASA